MSASILDPNSPRHSDTLQRLLLEEQRARLVPHNGPAGATTQSLAATAGSAAGSATAGASGASGANPATAPLGQNNQPELPNPVVPAGSNSDPVRSKLAITNMSSADAAAFTTGYLGHVANDWMVSMGDAQKTKILFEQSSLFHQVSEQELTVKQVHDEHKSLILKAALGIGIAVGGSGLALKASQIQSDVMRQALAMSIPGMANNLAEAVDKNLGYGLQADKERLAAGWEKINAARFDQLVDAFKGLYDSVKQKTDESLKLGSQRQQTRAQDVAGLYR